MTVTVALVLNEYKLQTTGVQRNLFSTEKQDIPGAKGSTGELRVISYETK